VPCHWANPSSLTCLRTHHRIVGQTKLQTKNFHVGPQPSNRIIVFISLAHRVPRSLFSSSCPSVLCVHHFALSSRFSSFCPSALGSLSVPRHYRFTRMRMYTHPCFCGEWEATRHPESDVPTGVVVMLALPAGHQHRRQQYWAAHLFVSCIFFLIFWSKSQKRLCRSRMVRLQQKGTFIL